MRAGINLCAVFLSPKDAKHDPKNTRCAEIQPRDVPLWTGAKVAHLLLHSMFADACSKPSKSQAEAILLIARTDFCPVVSATCIQSPRYFDAEVRLQGLCPTHLIATVQIMF